MAIEIIDLSSIYDLVYNRASLAMRVFDPCRIKEGRCLRGDFCCQGCQHLGRGGCTVQALACKLWLCLCAARDPRNKACKQILQGLREIAEFLKINGFRRSKEENLLFGEQIIVDSVWVNRSREKLRFAEEILRLPPARWAAAVPRFERTL